MLLLFSPLFRGNRKPRLREVEYLAQGVSGGKRLSWDLNPGCLAPEPSHVTLMLSPTQVVIGHDCCAGEFTRCLWGCRSYRGFHEEKAHREIRSTSLRPLAAAAAWL